MTDATPEIAKAASGPGADPGKFEEIGVSGLKVFGGFLNEEFLRELSGDQGRRKFREMADNDATIGAVLTAISLVIRAVPWTATANPDAPSQDQAEAEASFVESLLDDMSHTWPEFISECLSMLTFGWAYHEMVLKRRVGPYEKDPSKRSKYTDGRIGIRKLPIRAQETLLRWEMQDDGGISGLWQVPPNGGQTRYIPIERALLFRTISRKNSPEGVSILRNAYESWYLLRNIRSVEAIGIERELAGLPVVSIPARVLNATAAPDLAIKAAYEKIARDIKFNEQGGVVIPSDTYKDPDGKVSAVPLVKVELLKGGGARAIDTQGVKNGYKQDIANSVLAGFILLGSDSVGSFALSKDKTAFFTRACQALIDQIAGVLNRFMIPRIWDVNGLDRALMPTLTPGRLTAVDLDAIGNFIQKLAAAGAPLFPDDDLETRLREDADLPPPSPEALLYRQEQNDLSRQAQEAALQGKVDPAGKDDVQFGKADPASLYVRRDVLNSGDIIAWAKEQGLTSTIPADDMHVTVTYSRAPVDWMAMGESSMPKVEIAEGGPRLLQMFGEEQNVLVLAFASWQLSQRHDEMKSKGASWDWPEYEPHITIAYNGEGVDIDAIDPYTGKIELGPEIFSSVKADWQADIKEDPVE